MPPLHGLDIETDTTTDGLNPAVARVVAVAVASDDCDELVLTGDEAGILRQLDEVLAELPPGVLVTWNGSRFDLPFLADRARLLGVDLALLLRLDPAIALHRPPLAGHRGAYRARWGDHDHLDAYRAHRALAAPEEPGGLKAVARRAGLLPVEADAAAIHTLSPGDLRRYVGSDATMARELARRRWLPFAHFRDQPVFDALAEAGGASTWRAASG